MTYIGTHILIPYICLLLKGDYNTYTRILRILGVEVRIRETFIGLYVGVLLLVLRFLKFLFFPHTLYRVHMGAQIVHIRTH
ncbi:unnamed protein product [Linum tenue]|uniref:Uncharacterized protein n=1 Tax=Linum tenue TaxID=586396 RepID=A0AAV0JV78_9ROSI|nr:unnamed protein product [Linum tenue]